MKKYIFPIILLSSLLSVSAMANSDKPGKGVTVEPGRATWETGHFQGALISRGLKELGYKVKKPKDVQNSLFYLSVTQGDLDFWPNGNFPIHTPQLPENFDEGAQIIGDLVKQGGVQGYLISKEYAEELNIQSIEDFKRDDVKKAFDANGDGKADIVSCPPGWGCAITIDEHVKAYELDEHVNLITASYSAAIADAVVRHEAGEAVAFYTWTPNWTVYKLQPGKDVLWINVPPQEGSEVEPIALEGAVTEEVYTGFDIYDIQVVANKDFLAKNPAAKAFFEVVKLPIEDINAQNARMNEGEDSRKDIERHVDEWIENNQDLWNSWLETARQAS